MTKQPKKIDGKTVRFGDHPDEVAADPVVQGLETALEGLARLQEHADAITARIHAQPGYSHREIPRAFETATVRAVGPDVAFPPLTAPVSHITPDAFVPFERSQETSPEDLDRQALAEFEALSDDDKRAYCNDAVEALYNKEVLEEDIYPPLLEAMKQFVARPAAIAMQGPPEDPASITRRVHVQLVTAAKEGLIVTRDNAMSDGVNPLAMVGFVFDLTDPLVPAEVRHSPAAQETLQRHARGHVPLLTGIEIRDKLLPLLATLAHKIEGTTPPLLISSAYEEPGIVKTLRMWRDDTCLPVVVIAQGRLSIQGLTVSNLVKPKTSLPS